jgi:Uncharacterized homolog of Blt101
MIIVQKEVTYMLGRKSVAIVFIPPMAVLLRHGRGIHFQANIFLTLLGYIPGLIHAIWITTHKDL